MLQQLADRIRAGGTQETGRLAAELGAPRPLVEAMLEHLQRQGIIRAYVGSGPTCNGCTLSTTCTDGGEGGMRLWRGLCEVSPGDQQP